VDVTSTQARPGGAATAPAAARPVDRLPVWVPAWAPALLPAVLMLIVGGAGITRPGLGWDENATWIAGRRTPAQIVDLAGHFDGVISPYYLFMHFWTGLFGDSELSMRAPSLIAVAAGVGVTAELGRRLIGPAGGLLGGLFLVAVPQLSRYAEDARPYGLAFLFATLSTLLLYRALDRPGWRRWSPYAIVVCLLGMAHILGLLVLLGHAFIVLSRRGPRRWLVVTAVALLPVLPLIYLGLTQRGDQLGWIPPMAIGYVLAAPGDIFGSAAAGLLLIGLALAVRQPKDPVVRELAVLAAAPPAVLLAVSFVTSSLWVPRYVLIVVPAVGLLAAMTLRAAPVQAVLALLLLIGVGAPAQAAFRQPASHMGPDFRAVARAIRQAQQPGDVIVYGSSGTWSLRAGVDYQLRGGTKPADVLLRTPAAQIGQLNAVQCPDPVACLAAAPRVWLFRYDDPAAPLPATGPVTGAGSLNKTLTSAYTRARTWDHTKADLILFVRR
jgi:mannosyltransferase